ncbi:sensor histidine kinase [Robertmurraya mangrovi]|uniref:sensor histidine kinase n=1 Tax=Robertmurraya mangrovi TaxID=3098077 RepID=UPI002ACC1C94|nr:HAMP domain-containing sensor histidine kinase [Bacillus sp. 31A1R]
MYQGRIHNEIRNILVSNGEKVIEIYHSTESENLVPFLEAFSGTAQTRLQLFNKKGVPLLKDEMEIDKKYIESVIAGETVDNIQAGMKSYPFVGIPFQHGGESYALFLTVEENSVEDEIMNSIHLMYVIILFLGSLLIIIAARFVVIPLIRLTEATKKMAQGDFKIELSTKRKDEIGVLSASFNEMAHELSKLDQMRQEFVANVSHEIQSPLTSISGFSKALKQKNLSEEDRTRYLTIIEEESERLSRLGRNLLRLSHLQHDQHRLNITSFRLDEQLRNVVIGLEPQWSEKDLTLHIQLDPITVEADEDQLKQVWTNLINNSIKFTPVQGAIGVKAEVKNQLITVSIVDNGSGIPEEERKDIFKPFHKIDKSRDSSIKGNGLGLSIVKQIVDLHHGDIEVREGPEGGAKFTVTLPLTNSRA